jgi:hypothetical protein
MNSTRSVAPASTEAKPAQQQPVGRGLKTGQPVRPKSSGDLPEWLMVVLALLFVFVVLPALTPILFQIFVLNP